LSRSRLDTPARHQTAAELARAAAAYFDAYFDARREGHEVALAFAFFAGLFGAAGSFAAAVRTPTPSVALPSATPAGRFSARPFAADFFVADFLAVGLSDFLLVMGFFSEMADR
jgi:hypothetical protein